MQKNEYGFHSYQKKYQTMNFKEFGDLESLLIDAKIIAAGKQVAILTTSLSSSADLLNHNLERIESKLSTLLDDDVKFIAVSEEEWNNYKREYVQNLKNGVKYESGLQDLKPTKDDSQLQQFAERIFEAKKIEII